MISFLIDKNEKLSTLERDFIFKYKNINYNDFIFLISKEIDNNIINASIEILEEGNPKIINISLIKGEDNENYFTFYCPFNDAILKDKKLKLSVNFITSNGANKKTNIIELDILEVENTDKLQLLVANNKTEIKEIYDKIQDLYNKIIEISKLNINLYEKIEKEVKK